MSNFTKPVASSIGGVEFGILSDDEIKAISVKRIHNSPTLDSFNNPVPGGLYDPALGAWGDHTCTTCRQNSWSCTGHSGHIEIPVPVYNVTFFDQLLRILKAQCVYCHRLRMSRVQINAYACKFRLLQYGLVEELAVLEGMEIRKISSESKEGEDSESGEDEDAEDFMKRRNTFVRRSIRKAESQRPPSGSLELKDPVAAELRRTAVREFLGDISSVKKCTSCSGISPKYRRDKYSKIFRKSLPQKLKAAMTQGGFQAPNSLILIQEAKRASEKPKEPPVNKDAIGFSDDDNSNVASEAHGAEEQVARGNAVVTEVEEREAGKKKNNTESQQFVSSPEVYASLTLLFQEEQEIFDLVYNSRPRKAGDRPVSADMFFIKTLLVPPNKYRPAVSQGSSEIVEAQQNSSFTKILKVCDLINQIHKEMQGDTSETVTRVRNYRDLLFAIVQLQDTVNSLIDRDRNPVQGAAGKQNEDGIKQRLEKKDGLFRKNMMGKRVNFAARSVISPDPNIETNEIGIPLVFAKKLTYPEPVTNHNFFELKQAVINGPNKYPGATAIENEIGQVVSLKVKNLEERTALANSLLAPSNWRMKCSRNKKVYRHLTTGDVVLMNRQPTLHKPSIMGHRARVLPGERTIRMHYANCNTYNADFDGDEMNMHFPQNEIARAEAMQLADTDHQYLVATSGKPLRGLIQDHISMGTWFTCRNSLFDEDDYHQLLYNCLRPESSHTTTDRIQLVEPAILKPEVRWTGKQIITTILKNITPPSRAGLNLTGKLSTSADHWEDKSESKVIFQNGELLCGILDKSQLGPTAGGLIHSIHEVYGHVVAGKLIGILGRLLTKFLHMRAFTCGMDDLRLTKAGDLDRKKKLERAKTIGYEVAMKYVTLEQSSVNQDDELRRRLEDVLRDEQKQAGLDGVSNSRTAGLSSEITAACLPRGLAKKFPWNQMQAMTVSGAKGSIVNANLISCNLGQQVLEGRRVPVMISGKTLPSFQPFETNAMAGGYVSGRFLTGIKPQEYYFHAMAGREGLIDTAVKTSRSGYLQRCLIKGMEGLKAEYDTSVRETSDGSVIQFLYGEDGLDITKQKHLQDFGFLASNYLSIIAQVNAHNFHSIGDGEAATWNKNAMKKVKKTGAVDAMDPALAKFQPGGYLGSTSELFAMALKKYQDQNSDKLLRDKKNKIEGKLTKRTFTTMMEMKYMRSVVDPGEAVGIVAGQSVGEPSTQMTLNTFHLAGHSTKNVTLGIPRLREIVMTASDKILTPTMNVLLNPELSDLEAEKFAKAISKLTLAEVTDGLKVQERISAGQDYKRAKIYDIHIDFFPSEEYTEEYRIRRYDVLKALQHKFIPRLVKLTRAELKKRSEEKTLSSVSAAQPEVGASSGTIEEASRDVQGEADDMDDNDDDDDEDNAEGRNKKQNRSNPVSYEAPDEGDIVRQGTPEFESDEEDQPDGKGSDVDMEDADDSEAEAIRNPKDREVSVKDNYPEVTRFKFDPKKGESCTIQLQYDISTPKLLLLPLVENAIHSTILQSIPGLGNSAFIPEENGKPRHVDTDGVNLLAMRDYQEIIRPHSIYTNSIAHMLRLYGVEAARSTIIKEMDAVFSGHSIAVDNRHLNLIGDVMTQAGGFRAFNRMGVVKSSTSPFMKMSFETTVGFLKDAVLERDYDTLTGPSSRIVTGQIGTIGTGGFDVLAPVG